MSSHHRSTRWAGVATRPTASSLTSDPSGNKPGAGATANTNKAKLIVSSTSTSPRLLRQQQQQQQLQQQQQQQRFYPSYTNAQQNHPQQPVQTAATATGSSFSRAGTLNSSSASTGPGSGVAARPEIVEVSSVAGRSPPGFAHPSPQSDLSTGASDAQTLDGYRNDQLVAFPAAISDESEFHDPDQQQRSSAGTPDLRRVQEQQPSASAAEGPSPEQVGSGQESPLRRGPSSAALASRRLADALENDQVGTLYNSYRDEWSPEPINTAPDPSQPMLQQHRPASAASILPAPEGYRSAGGVTHFSSAGNRDDSQASAANHTFGAQLSGISESNGDSDAPPPRPPPPVETSAPAGAGAGAGVAVTSTANTAASAAFSSTTIPGGENIKTAAANNRQFQGPTSRNRRPLLPADSGVLQELGVASAMNGGSVNGVKTMPTTVGPVPAVAKAESAYSESFVGRGSSGGVNGFHHMPKAMPSPSSTTATMISVNTVIGQNTVDRSVNNTPSYPNKYSTFMASSTGTSSVGLASNSLGAPAGFHSEGSSPAVTMSRAYGSRQAVAALRQSGSSTPRYIAASGSVSGRSSPPETTYYENTDEYPGATESGMPTEQSASNGVDGDAIAAFLRQQSQMSEQTSGSASGSAEFPPPPSAASQDNLLAKALLSNGTANHHRHDGSIGEAGSVALDLLNRAPSPLVSGQVAAGLAAQVTMESPPLSHTRHESAPVRPQASTPTGSGGAFHHRVASQPSTSSMSAAQLGGTTPSRNQGSGGGGGSRSPWQRKHLFRLCQSNSSQSPLLHNIPSRSLDRLGLFLNRFLFRVMSQARSLSHSVRYCSHHEVVTAIMLVAPAGVAEGCIGAAVKARLAYAMSANAARFRTSKSHRCDLELPVARIHQWLVMMQVARIISDCAAVYLAAATEHLGNLIVSRVIAESRNQAAAAGRQRGSIAEEATAPSGGGDGRAARDPLFNGQVLSVDMLDYAVSCSPEIWSIVQQHPFLVTPKAVPVSSSPTSVTAMGSALGEVRHGWEASMQSLNSSFSGQQSDRDSWKASQHPRAPSAASNTTDSTSSSALGSPSHHGGLSRNPSGRMTSQSSSGDMFRFPSSSVAAVDTRDKLHELIEQVYAELKTPGQGMSPYIHSPLPRRRSMQPGTTSSVILPSPPGLTQGKLPSWSRAALDTLFHFVSSRRFTGAVFDQRTHLFASYIKSSKTLPSVADWIRLSATFAQYRCCPIVDNEDVMLTAELLLPGIVTPPFVLKPFSGWQHVSPDEQGDSQDLALYRLKTDELFVSVRDAPMVAVAQLMRLYNDNILVTNSQGLTMLMVACMDGNEALAEYLCLHKPDHVNVTVPRPGRSSPAAMPTVRGWTALHFAVAGQQPNIVKHLLLGGADVEGRVPVAYTSQDVSAAATHSPLQLACAAGYVDIIELLLDSQADPFLSPPAQRLQQDTTSAFLSCAFAMAATHGQQDAMNALLARPIHSTAQDKISLTDVLAEADGSQSGEDSLRQLRSRAMQESIFLAAEHGHIDLALMMRKHGIPWTLHSWGEAVDATYHNSARAQVLKALLTDFNTVLDIETSAAFCHDTLPLLFSLLRQNLDLSHHIAVVLQTCYGQRFVPSISMIQPMPSGSSQLDVSWVNNPDMADIIFIVEGRQFFAHRIMMVKASSRFQALLSASPVSQTGAMTIDLPNIPYGVLDITIRYIYTGGVSLDIPKHILIQDLLSMARFFELWRLHQHCEVLAGNTLGADNVCELYTFTKTHEAPILKEACESFFLAQLTQVCRKPPFRKLLAEMGKEFIEMLRSLVVARLKQRGRGPQQVSYITAC